MTQPRSTPDCEQTEQISNKPNPSTLMANEENDVDASKDDLFLFPPREMPSN